MQIWCYTCKYTSHICITCFTYFFFPAISIRFPEFESTKDFPEFDTSNDLPEFETTSDLPEFDVINDLLEFDPTSALLEFVITNAGAFGDGFACSETLLGFMAEFVPISRSLSPPSQSTNKITKLVYVHLLMLYGQVQMVFIFSPLNIELG